MERTVACEVNNSLVGISELSAYGSSVSEAHGSKASACKEVSWLLVVYVLRRPHLMLPHVCNIYCILSGLIAYGLDYLLRIKHIVIACNLKRMLLICRL